MDHNYSMDPNGCKFFLDISLIDTIRGANHDFLLFLSSSPNMETEHATRYKHTDMANIKKIGVYI